MKERFGATTRAYNSLRTPGMRLSSHTTINASANTPISHITAASHGLIALLMKQLTVLGVTNNEMTWEPLLGLVARGTVNVRDMVTHRFALEELPQAIALVSSRPPELIKAVVHPWD